MTGANYLLEAGGLRIVIDMGLIQGSQFNEDLNWEPLGYDASTVDVVFITHSHVDHMGRLPKLYRDGFRGVIYAIGPTTELIRVALPDTLRQMGDSAISAGREPLFTLDDLEETLHLLRPLSYRQRLVLNEQVTVIGHDTGHVLGSAAWEVIVTEGDTKKRILFPGDIGNPPAVLLNPIDYVRGVDYTLVESAYGNRLHEGVDTRREILMEVVHDTYTRGGALMIPSFAVERTQELLLELDTLFEQGKLPPMPVFVDSPLAIAVTQVYGEFSKYFNQGAREILRDNRGIFQFPWLTFTRTPQESKRINTVEGPKIIIAGSGMSQGGRIVHHEARYLSDPASTILFVGYQVQGSLGRRIRDEEPEVTVVGRRVPVRCRVVSIGAYSAHADQNGLVEYVRQANQGGTLKKCFVVQGERDGAEALAMRIHGDLGVEAVVPEMGQSFELI